MNRPPLMAKLLLAVLATAAALVAPVTTPAATSADNPYQRGPAPTVQSIEATRGSYAISQVSISELGDLALRRRHDLLPDHHRRRHLRRGRRSRPASPPRSPSIAWLGPRLASHGFVVVTIDTNTIYDQPAAGAPSCSPRSTT